MGPRDILKMNFKINAGNKRCVYYYVEYGLKRYFSFCRIQVLLVGTRKCKLYLCAFFFYEYEPF